MSKNMRQNGFGPGYGAGPGRGPGRGLGLGGKCVCPKCGHETEHVRGMPCFKIKCPKCGEPLTRKE